MRDGDLEIYLMDANGGRLTRLTDNEVDDAVSRWSPDGNQIAYQFESETGNWTLALMDADGKHQRLIMPRLSWDTEPAWAPPGYNSVPVNPSGKYRIIWGEIK
jgi:TolB protein